MWRTHKPLESQEVFAGKRGQYLCCVVTLIPYSPTLSRTPRLLQWCVSYSDTWHPSCPWVYSPTQTALWNAVVFSQHFHPCVVSVWFFFPFLSLCLARVPLCLVSNAGTKQIRLYKLANGPDITGTLIAVRNDCGPWDSCDRLSGQWLKLLQNSAVPGTVWEPLWTSSPLTHCKDEENEVTRLEYVMSLQSMMAACWQKDMESKYITNPKSTVLWVHLRGALLSFCCSATIRYPNNEQHGLAYSSKWQDRASSINMPWANLI